MMKSKAIAFQEGLFSVRTIVSEEERNAVYKLRHQVYCETLNWVPRSITGLEVDEYDKNCVLLGSFLEDGRLTATLRFLHSDTRFMLEREFAELLPPGFSLKKCARTAEVTRLATLAPVDRSHVSRGTVLDVIFKAMYQWSAVNRIRYLYFVVERRFLRLMLMRGFHCRALGSPGLLNEKGKECVAVLLDWDEPEHPVRNEKHRRYFSWLRSANLEFHAAA